MDAVENPAFAFLKAACVPLKGHASGTLDRAEAIRAEHPEVASASIYAVAVLGDEPGVRRFLAEDAANAIRKGGPYEWDALTYLCFSQYLRLDAARSRPFVATAQALLDRGANAQTGFYADDHQPHPVFESAIYGAAGIAHHPELTRLLLERGADPNDEETPYHAPETADNAALHVLVESGKVNPDSMATLLLRKFDWHDFEGIQWLLDHGADPNRLTPWGRTALHHAIERDNALASIEVLFDHGANPMLEWDGQTAVALAARRGRRDVLEALERRAIPFELRGVERLIAACAKDDTTAVASEPGLVPVLITEGGLLARFAGNGNTEGVRQLLDLGVDVNATFNDRDGYWGLAGNSTALHVAAWRAHHNTVKLLLERGAAVDAVDARGRTPLMLAVQACVDSFWTHRRSPDSVAALLEAGARADRISVPTGYDEIDRLLRPLA